MTLQADPLFDLTDRVIVVTGGSRGLGREMCLAFAARGATVVVASRKEGACLETAAELNAITDSGSIGIACHVGRWADCDRLVEAVYDRFGRVDVLVNNAGAAPLYTSLSTASEELFDKTLAVNLKGAFRLSACIGERMVAAGGGRIVNVSSVAAVEPRSDDLIYAAAKAGLDALTVGLARTFAPAVQVNGIMPGPFMTDISHAWDPDRFAEAAARVIPLGRGGAPTEIVGAAVYLAAAASSYTTGTIIRVDGGMMAPLA